MIFFNTSCPDTNNWNAANLYNDEELLEECKKRIDSAQYTSKVTNCSGGNYQWIRPVYEIFENSLAASSSIWGILNWWMLKWFSLRSFNNRPTVEQFRSAWSQLLVKKGKPYNVYCSDSKSVHTDHLCEFCLKHWKASVSGFSTHPHTSFFDHWLWYSY